MKPRRQSFWLPGSLSLFCLVTTSPIRAQIVPDATLPNPSIVTPNDNTSVITGGTQAGPNLFHSFRQFSVNTGESASFQQIDQGIENVISRVTGSNVSNIDGLIEVLQANGTVSPANFFLLNSNGIIFGPNASLNIGGSFLASTASSLNFADGNSFSTTNSQTTEPLLTVSVPIGLQFGISAGSIQVQGATLQVLAGKTLGLVGGDLTLVEEGELRAEEGRIELGSVAGVMTPGLAPVQVSLTPITKGWALGYEGVQNFQDIQLSQGAEVIASGSGGGDIQVQGRRVTLTGGSQMSASTEGSNPGGTLAVTVSESVEISGISISPDGVEPSGLFARVRPEATGAGGNLTIETRQLRVLDGAEVSTDTSGSGKAGNLTVQATESVLVSGTDEFNFGSTLRATVQPEATGDGGILTIETGRLIVWDGGQVLTSTFGQGQAGNLTVQNATEVELVGGIIAEGEFRPSGLFTQASAEATGDGGNLTMSAGKLTVRGGAQVNSTTFGAGNAGNLTVRATDVELVGAALSADGELLTNEFGLPFGSGLFAGTEIGSGDGGTLTVETDRLSLRDGGVVQTATFGEGDAGKLIVQATDSVELVGPFADDRFPTSLSAYSGGIPGLSSGVFDAKGRGGDLTITTGELIVQDRAVVAVSSLNQARDALGAGNLRVQAQTIRLENLGQLTAETNSGQGGNITLLVQDLLLLRRDSEISTTAGIAGAGGDGGNITIDTPFIVAVPEEDSNITANAFTGNGGRVRITTQGVFGLERRSVLTPLSDITAFSQQNPELNGVVEINTPDVDPSRGLVTLPAELVDASGLIAQTCPAGRGQGQSEFIVTGRGGLPDNPNETLSSDAVEVDLVTLNPKVENRSSPTVSTLATSSTSAPIVEAQGWVIGANGEVVLTATAPTVTPHSPGLTPAQCHTPKSTPKH